MQVVFYKAIANLFLNWGMCLTRLYRVGEMQLRRFAHGRNGALGDGA